MGNSCGQLSLLRDASICDAQHSLGKRRSQNRRKRRFSDRMSLRGVATDGILAFWHPTLPWEPIGIPDRFRRRTLKPRRPRPAEETRPRIVSSRSFLPCCCTGTSSVASSGRASCAGRVVRDVVVIHVPVCLSGLQRAGQVRGEPFAARARRRHAAAGGCTREPCQMGLRPGPHIAA